MGKLQNVLSIAVEFIKQIVLFWAGPLLWAFLKTIIWAGGILGAELMFNFFAFLYAKYRLNEVVVLSDYYENHYSVGVLWGVLIIFIILLLHEAAQKNRKTEIKASRFMWDDVKIKPKYFPKDSKFVCGVTIQNTKPFELQDIYLDLTYLEINKVEISLRENVSDGFPRLGWVDSDGLTLQHHNAKIGKNGGNLSFVFVRSEPENYEFYYYVLSKDLNQYIPTWVNIEKNERTKIRGLVNVRGRIAEGRLDEEYVHNFTIDMYEKKAGMKTGKGKFKV